MLTDISEFKKASDVIVTNRMTDDLNDVVDKVFTKGIYFVKIKKAVFSVGRVLVRAFYLRPRQCQKNSCLLWINP